MKKIPFSDNFFDGVLCVWSMGHGTLEDHKNIMGEIYKVLKPKGILITDFMSTKDKTYGKGKEIEKNTFIGGMKGEEDVLHHYFTKQELKEIFSKFSETKINPTTFVYFNEKAKKCEIEAFNVQAVK